MSGQNIEFDKNLINFPIEPDPFPIASYDKNIACDKSNSSNGADIKLYRSSTSEHDPAIIYHRTDILPMVEKSLNEDQTGKFIFKPFAMNVLLL